METGKPAWLDLAQHDITTTPRASPPARLRIHEGRNAQPSPQLMEKEGSHSPPPLPPPPSAQIPSRHPSCLQVKAGRLKNDRTSPSPVSLLLLSAGELIGFFLIRKTRGQKERKKERKEKEDLARRSVGRGRSVATHPASVTHTYAYVLRTTYTWRLRRRTGRATWVTQSRAHREGHTATALHSDCAARAHAAAVQHSLVDRAPFRGGLGR